MRILQAVSSFSARHRGLLLTLAGLVGAFLLLNYMLLPAYVNRGGTLNVPHVIDRPYAEARRMLDSAGLEAVQADTRPDPERPAGIVINQNPLPQAAVKEGRRVYLTISGGEVLVPVPLLRGRSMRDARFALERNGLRLGGVTYQPSETFPENTVIEQSVGAETRIPRGGTVGVVVSQGRATLDVVVPALLGKTLMEAERLIGEAGLKLGNVTYQPSFELLPNTVVDQYPRGGEAARRGQEVDIFVVKAGRPEEEIEARPPQP